MSSHGGDVWDDDRLETAFAARDAERTTPSIEPTLQRLRAQQRQVRWTSGLRPALALVAVLAVAILVGSLSIASHPATIGRPTVSDGAPSAMPTSNPTVIGDTALGLPIISVADAITVRDAGVDDRELAVRGWFTPATPEIFCALLLRQIRPVQFGCGDQFRWLTQDRDATVRTTNGTTEFVPPSGPAIHPSFDQLDPGWYASVPELNPRACGRQASCPPAGTSVSIVAIGHFDDRRSARCAPKHRTQCQDRFVVDRVDTVQEQWQELSVVDDVAGHHVWSLDDITRLDPLGPTESRLSVEVVNSQNHLSIEPTLASDPAWSREKAVWLVRDLVDGRAMTRVIADGSQDVFEFQADGTLARAR